MRTLRASLIHLAYRQPELRAHLLPLLKTAGGTDLEGLLRQLQALEAAVSEMKNLSSSNEFQAKQAKIQAEKMLDTVRGLIKTVLDGLRNS